jgi:spermidine/putrescine transport system ATP-binding protein
MPQWAWEDDSCLRDGKIISIWSSTPCTGADMATAAVELHDVCKIIGQQRVLNGVSLQVGPGEFFALLGPSGCGKTTMLRLIAGFDQPTSGVILINGQPMAAVPPYRRDVNMVFQNYALFPHLTVFQNIAFGLEMQGLEKSLISARVTEALELVRLRGLEGRYPHQLSGGEQQRVALARAVVRRPSALLLDEPLGALDLPLRKAMQLELKRLQRRLDITFIYVTHDQEEALTMADRMAVMHAGQVLQTGSPAELYERPASRFVAGFIGDMNVLTGRVSACEDDAVCVQVAQAVLRACAVGREQTMPGQTVTIAIRPEKILLHGEPRRDYPNNLPATVEDVIYLGTETRYFIRLSDDHVLSLRRQNVDQDRGFPPGARVFACFAAHSAQILPEA